MIVRRVPFGGDGPDLEAALAGLPGVFALDDSGPHRRRPLTIVAFAPRAELVWTAGAGTLSEVGGASADVADLFAGLRELGTRTPPLVAPPEAGDLPFVGGLLGFLGYGARTAVEILPDRAPRELSLPDVWFGAYGTVACLEEGAGEAVLLGGGDDPDDAGLLDAAAGRIAAAAIGRGAAAHQHVGDDARSSDATPAEPFARRPAVSGIRPGDYLDRVEQVREAIRAGEVYQVNLTQRFLLPFASDPRALWRLVRKRHPAPYGACFRIGATTVLSASPESFLEVRGDRVLTRPIKGTIARGRSEAEDAARAATLQASEKDRAELAMIVDLMRNDLSRVCAPGTVRVNRHATIATAPTVHHLESEVEGRLAPGADVFDLLRTAFPAGSITGAPKLRAMELIDGLEAVHRGVYTGSIGYLGRDGRAELSVAIRTLAIEGGFAHVYGGGGVVIDSDPAAEYDESVVKVRGLLDALEGVIRP